MKLVMDFKDLETFMKLIEYGTYSLTAKALFISQPTVTTRIQNLENELGVTLLMRSGKGYRPTEAGSILAGYAGRILQIHGECLKSLSRMGDHKTKSLRIGTTALGTYVLPHVTKKIKEHYPQAKLFFSINNTSEALESLKNGSVDAVLAPLSLDTEKSDEFHFLNVGQDALVLLASAGNPISKLKKVDIQVLQQERFIVRERGSNTRKILEDWLHTNGFDKSNIVEIGQPEAIRRAVANNVGISLLSTMSFQHDDTSIKRLDLEGFPVFREFYIITRNKGEYDPLIDAFSVFVKEIMKEHLS